MWVALMQVSSIVYFSRVDYAMLEKQKAATECGLNTERENGVFSTPNDHQSLGRVR